MGNNRTKIKHFISKYPRLVKIISYGMHVIAVRKSLKASKIINKGYGKIKKDIIGKDNEIFVGKGTKCENLVVRIRGNNNKLVIYENCKFGKSCSFWLEGNNIEITIGVGCTFTQICHFCAQEDKSMVRVGQDCMFSNHIIVRTSDAHPIYDKNSLKRINNPGPVIIGDHVWIAPNTKIMKGAVIPNGCIIGSDTTINKAFNESNSLLVGRPARIVKSNIEWTREKLF